VLALGSCWAVVRLGRSSWGRWPVPGLAWPGLCAAAGVGRLGVGRRRRRVRRPCLGRRHSGAGGWPVALWVMLGVGVPAGASPRPAGARRPTNPRILRTCPKRSRVHDAKQRCRQLTLRARGTSGKSRSRQVTKSAAPRLAPRSQNGIRAPILIAVYASNVKLLQGNRGTPPGRERTRGEMIQEEKSASWVGGQRSGRSQAA
jgi:hypothetical protein